MSIVARNYTDKLVSDISAAKPEDAMPYAKTSLRKEKRDLRDKMRGLGLGYREIAAEFARRYNIRPRAAWREAYGWSLQETADRINGFRGQVGLDPGGFAGMTASHLCEHENWPGHGPAASGRRPTPYLLAVLAAVYDCGIIDLIDLADREHLPPADLLILDKYSQVGESVRVGQQAPRHTLLAPGQKPDLESSALSSGAVPLPEAEESGADARPAVEAHPRGLSRREALADMGGLAVGVIQPSPVMPSGVAVWADALCRAVVDPARAARESAALAQWGQRHDAMSHVLQHLRHETKVMTVASLMSDYGLLAKALPGLIGRAELGQVTAGTDEEVASIEPVLSDLYAVAAWTLIKADRPEAAWIAAKRSVHAAAAADDCLRSAAAARCLAEVHMRAGNFADAARVAFLATAHLDAAPHRDRDAVLCLRGAAMLSAAAAAARRGDSYEADAALRAARAYASEAGRDLVVLGTMFGPINVLIHNVAIPVELGRPGEAVCAIPVGPVQVPSHLAERKARFLIDIARSHAGTGDARAAEDALAQAEQAAPDETRHHRLTRQLISELLPRSHRSSEIRALAERCGLPA